MLDQFLQLGYKIFPLSNFSKRPVRGLSWRSPENHITAPIEGQRNYGIVMDASGLLGIDLDAVNKKTGKVLSISELAGWWRRYAEAIGFPYSEPHCITAGGKGHPGLHYYYTVQPHQKVGGAKLHGLPVDLRGFAEAHVDVRTTAYLVTPGSVITRDDGSVGTYEPGPGSLMPPPLLDDSLAQFCTVAIEDGRAGGEFIAGPSFIRDIDSEKAVAIFANYCRKHSCDIAPGQTHNALTRAVLYGRDVGLSKPKVFELISELMNGGEDATNPRPIDRLTRLVDTTYYTSGGQGVSGFGILHPDVVALRDINPNLHATLTAAPLFDFHPDIMEYGGHQRAAPLTPQAEEIAKEASNAVAREDGISMKASRMIDEDWQGQDAHPIIEGLATRGEITFVAAQPGQFKTTVVASVCAVAALADLGDMQGLFDPNMVCIFLAAEGGQNLYNTYLATQMVRDVPLAHDHENRFRVIRQPSPLVKAEAGSNIMLEMAWTALEDEIIAVCAEIGPEAAPVLVLDSLSSVTMGEVNDKGLAGRLMVRLRQTINKVNGAAVMIAHPPKNAKHAVAGAGEFEALGDTNYVAKGNKTDDGAVVTLTPAKDRGSPGSLCLRIIMKSVVLPRKKQQVQAHGKTVKAGFRKRREQQTAALGFRDMDFVEAGEYTDSETSGALFSDNEPNEPEDNVVPIEGVRPKFS